MDTCRWKSSTLISGRLIPIALPTWGDRPSCGYSARANGALRNQRGDSRRVVGRVPPTRGSDLPRGTVLRLADLCLRRAGGDAHGPRALARAGLVARFWTWVRDRNGTGP